MHEIAGRFATQAALPLVLDSTEPPVLEAGLQHIGGRALLNSANLEDGEAPGSRCDRVFALAREYGAAVICLTIDEEGQARTAEWKFRVAKRIHDLAIERYGLEPGDLIFDALTFPLGTGQEDLRRDAIETMDAIRRIKAELPGVSTVLGVSNVSFGLKPAIRHVLNSVFLHECVQAGLDAAIVHAAADPADAQDRRAGEGAGPRPRSTTGAATGTTPSPNSWPPSRTWRPGVIEREDRSGWAVEERLKARIIDGDRDGLEAELDEALTGGRKALSIINDVLLEGMKVVGDLFGSGQMQLPFVLQSAETMKTAVAFLEPHMEKADSGGKGRVVLGTVKGDVHDIGKNLVDIILTNNGYEVKNLGIKVPIAEFIEAVEEFNADAVGMSGLLVKSTLIMRDNLEELNARGLEKIPVLLGGAALTRSYVERDLREIYKGRLFYGKDAFEGLRTMETLIEGKKSGQLDPDFGRTPGGRALPPRKSQRQAEEIDPALIPARSAVATDNPVFKPPFLGSRVAKGIPLDDIAAYLNETALFRNQWQFRPEAKPDGKPETDEQFKARIRPTLRAELAKAKEGGTLVPAVAWGYFPVNADGNDLVVWTDDDRTEERTRFTFPRQRKEPWQSIADFFRPGRLRRSRLRRLPRGDDERRRLGPLGRAVRRQPVPGLPVLPRPVGGDGRSAGRVLAPPHPGGVGLRRRGRPDARRPVQAAVPGVALLLGLPRLPRPRRPGQGRRPPRDRTHRRDRLRGVPAPPRAVHLGDHRPPPRGQVLHPRLKPAGSAPGGISPTALKLAFLSSIPGTQERRIGTGPRFRFRTAAELVLASQTRSCGQSPHPGPRC